MRLRYLLCLLLLLLSMPVPGQGQAGKAAVPAQWQELTNDQAFGYRDEVELVPRPKVNNRQNALSAAFGVLVAFFSTTTGKAIIWTCLFLLLAYTLFRAFISDKTSLFRRREAAAGPPPEETATLPEDLLSTNWEHHLARAIQAGDMRLAVRYSYMRLLQLMQERHWIQYRNDKTNYDYYHELSNNAYKQPFMQLTRQYEYAWYGNYPLAKEKYEGYMATFHSLKTALHRS